MLQSADLLVHFDLAKPLILATDALDYGVGAVLSRHLPDGSEKPIGYALQSLNPAERNYLTIEKKTLAILFGVKKKSINFCMAVRLLSPLTTNP